MRIEQKLANEFKELQAKIMNLHGFIGCVDYDELNDVQQTLLIAQLKAMETYASILEMRIHHLD
jgi:hypothetical protein